MRLCQAEMRFERSQNDRERSRTYKRLLIFTFFGGPGGSFSKGLRSGSASCSAFNRSRASSLSPSPHPSSRRFVKLTVLGEPGFLIFAIFSAINLRFALATF